jgi:hypothetical protein
MVMVNKSPDLGNIGGVMLNKTGNIIWLMISLFAVLIVSCAAPAADAPTADAALPPSITAPPQAPAGSEDMIEPGDMIGEMVVTEAGAWNWDTNLYSLCEQRGEKVEDRSEESKVVVDVNCQLYPGTHILLTCSGVTADRWPGSRFALLWLD